MKNIDKHRKIVLKAANIFETILAILLLLAVFLGMIDTLRNIYADFIVNFSRPIDYSELNSIFAKILLLVIGVELAIMLSLHIQRALIDVLLFGIARKMLLLPKSDGMTEIMFGVIAIGLLFVIKKYLISDSEDHHNSVDNIANKIKNKVNAINKNTDTSNSLENNINEGENH